MTETSNNPRWPSGPVEKFQHPVRAILSMEDLEKFKKSATYNEIVIFLTELNESVRGKDNTVECYVSEPTQILIDIIQTIQGYVDEFPVADQTASRFGKLEFRSFYDHIRSHSAELLSRIPQLGPDAPLAAALPELTFYLGESWGNRSRIDYGSGHELNFIALLLCLKRLGIVGPKDYTALVTRVFILSYLPAMRKIQMTYWLEPAGSHGVWGLDDYHFLPFLFGSAQLAEHKHLRPKSIHNQDLLEEFRKKYVYFDCIYFINSIKTEASLRWHSPMLDDISGVKTWAKVNEGMMKMYKAEVLGKLPIMQHFFFGGILTAPEGVGEEEHAEGADEVKDGTENPVDSCGHNHPHLHAGKMPIVVENNKVYNYNTVKLNNADSLGVKTDEDSGEVVRSTYGDCCGIKVPSAVAVRQAERAKAKRIPFD